MKEGWTFADILRAEFTKWTCKWLYSENKIKKQKRDP